MAHIVMAYIVMASRWRQACGNPGTRDIVMAHIVMACIVMAPVEISLASGLWQSGDEVHADEIHRPLCGHGLGHAHMHVGSCADVWAQNRL